MGDKNLKSNDTYIDLLRGFLRAGGSGLREIPRLVKVVIKENMWKDRIVRATGERVQFNSFVEFVQADPLEGLGGDLDMLKRICGQDKVALDLIDQVTRAGPGTRTDLVYNIHQVDTPKGTSSARAFRRLRKQRPDLHKRVLNNELSPHAAMIDAGFRERKPQIPIHPERAAGIIRKYFSQSQIKELIRFLENKDA